MDHWRCQEDTGAEAEQDGCEYSPPSLRGVSADRHQLSLEEKGKQAEDDRDPAGQEHGDDLAPN